MNDDKTIYKITEEVLNNLIKDIPFGIIEKLKIIEGKKFIGINNFETELKLLLNNDFDSFKKKIIDESIIIEDDKDTEEEELYKKGDKESIYPYDPSKADIDIREAPQTVYELVVRKWVEKKIVKMPEFQRKFVWKQNQQSLFIESVLLGFPLPPLYINKSKEGDFIVVDGRQRLTTLKRFLHNEFRLSELNALPELNGKNFDDLIKLNPEYQTKIEDTKLLVYLIQPSVPLEMVYDIFNRINTGGTQLTRQEIRNCIYLGKATQLLQELASSKIFRIAIDNGISPLRAKDQEAVLRVISFMLFDYEKDYKNSMNTFVENAMKKINTFNDSEIESVKNKFNTSMKTTTKIFGSWNNFRIPTDYTRGRINIAVMESVANYFAKISPDSITDDLKEKYQDKYEHLMNDREYYNAVRFSTGSTSSVRTRFKKVKEYFDLVKRN